MSAKITIYEDLSQLDRDTLDRVIDHQREAYGYNGYGKYAFCTNPECRRVQSIDEIYGVRDTSSAFRPLEELEKNGCNVPDCPDCKSPCQLIFDPDVYRLHLASLCRNAYGAILSDETEAVRGISVMRPTTLREYFEKQGMDWNALRAKTAEVLDMGVSESMPVISVDRMSVSRPFREGGTLIKLGGAALNARPENDGWPSLTSLRYDDQTLPILEAVGYREIAADQYGTATMGIRGIGALRAAFNLGPEALTKTFGSKIMAATVGARTKSRQFSGVRHDKGSKLLARLQKVASLKKPDIPIKSEVLTSVQLDDERLDEISDFFRCIFNNDWPEFVVCKSCDSALPAGMRLSAKDIFGQTENIPLETMDRLGKMPDCPHCSKPMVVFHDPEKTRNNIAERLSRDGYVSLLRTADDNRIAGFIFGYGSTLGEEFHHEWRNKYHYSAVEEPEYDRSLDELVRLLEEHVPEYQLTPESRVFAWNCVALGPEIRNMRHFLKMTKAFFNSLPPEKRHLPVVGEVLKGSAAYSIFHKLGGIDVPGYFSGDDTIIIGQLGTVIDRINQSSKRK